MNFAHAGSPGSGMWFSDCEVAGGLALLEDAAMTAVSGALGPFATGDIFCNAIDVCRRLADCGRASEWTDAASQWCDRQGILGFPGMCRVSRAGILRLRGALADTAREATNACDELRPYDMGATSQAFYELGEPRPARSSSAPTPCARPGRTSSSSRSAN